MIRIGSLLPSSAAGRSRLVHFLGIALTLSAAKVVLHTLAAALFFSREGPDQLPLFYIMFAGLAVMISAGFSAVVDAMPPFVLTRWTMVIALVVGLLLRQFIAFDLPAVYFLLLAAAHIYDIISDIVFWVAAAAHFTSRELKRHSSYFFLAWAAGGAIGGVLANALLVLFMPEDLIFAFLALSLLPLVQTRLAEGRMTGHPEEQEDPEHEYGLLASVRAVPSLVARYPYVTLLACNALMLMLLYCLSEYLWATVYVTAFPDEVELAGFVAKVYVVVQVLEFSFLIVVSQPLLERTGPMARNLVFPLTSLGCLAAFAFSPKLPAAVAIQVNSEAISNAIFEPASNANYTAVPQHFHGRVRTLVDGVFYPAGMAAAGLVLAWGGGPPTSLTVVGFMALVVALVFLALNVGLGSLYLPTLVRTLRSGIVHFAEVAAQLQPPKLSERDVRRFIHASDAATRAVGFMALERQLDPTPLQDDLRGIAARADRATRKQLVGLLRGMPERHAKHLSVRLLHDDDVGEQLVALQYLLGRSIAPHQARLQALSQSSRTAVAMLARLVVAGDHRPTITEICSELRDGGALIDAECRTALIDAVATAGRAGLAPVLVALIDSAPPEAMREALIALARVASPRDAAAAACARQFVGHPDHQVRAAAISALGALQPRSLDQASLDLGLTDPNPTVRRRATEALARHGDAAVDIVATRLSDPDVRVVRAAVRALGKIRSRRARKALKTFLQGRTALGVRRLSWLGELPGGRRARCWQALRFVLEESDRRTLDLALEALAALGEERVVQNVRRVFESEGPRRRADAVETLLALRHRSLATAVLPLLEALGAPDEPPPADDARPAPADVCAAAMSDPDPWVRAAARLATGSGDQPARQTDGETTRSSTRPMGEVTEADVHRVLFLKSIPLFHQLPLDTLIAVAEVLMPRQCAAGEEIHRAGRPLAELLVLESGVVAFMEGRREVERLAAPAVFGEQALVEDIVWSRAAVALEPCSLLTMHRTVFRDLAQDFPEIVVELSRLLARRREDRRPEPDTPSMVVVPFANMSGDLDHFANGIAEDLITELSKYRWFPVIAPSSSFVFKGEAQDPKDVARTLGARYVLTGRVRRAGQRIRITAQLVDAVAGYQVWADRYDRELGDIFSVQDEITTSIVSAVAPHFLSAETRRAQRKDVGVLTTWEFVMRARWHHARGTERDCIEAHELLKKALALDPLNVSGHCLEALTHLTEIQFGWTRSAGDSLAAAVQSARTAARLDAHDAMAHTALGLADLTSRRYQDASARFEHAVSLNPNLAVAQGGLGQAYALSGDYEPAVGQIQNAIRLSPEDPFVIYWLDSLGLAAFAAGRYEEAASWGAKAVNRNPDSPAGHRLLATSLAHLGRVEEAQAELKEVLQHMPGMTAKDVGRQVPFKRTEDTERYVEGLRKAGLRE